MNREIEDQIRENEYYQAFLTDSVIEGKITEAQYETILEEVVSQHETLVSLLKGE